MAKNKIKIDVEVDDNGNLQQVEKKAKKAAKGLNGVAEGGRVADRTLKGTAGASSNTTKNFSKMAQGINGGLVPAYAVLAANIFAVSAAFSFLKNAGDLVALKAGQIAYAGATGIALRSLSNDIVAATDAQINFTEASQAAAIGTAAGLQATQLTQLAEGAKNVSILLGRDVTDSFNRLIRGVTKAEPELLDELGIILRLDNATKNYSRTINKSAKDFTEFERSQAVTAEVLSQLDQKYTRIAAITELNVNDFAKLGKAFDDIVNQIKEVAVVILGPVAQAIVETPKLGIALLGLFAKSVITAALPAIATFGEAAEAAGLKASEAYTIARADMEKLGTTTDRVAGKQAAAARAQALASTGFSGKGFQMIAAGKGGDLSAQQIVGMRSAVNASKKLSREMREAWVRELDIMLAATKRSTIGIQQSFQVAATGITGIFAKMRVAVNAALAGIATAARVAASVISRAFSFLGYIALAYSLFEVARAFFKTKEEASEATKVLLEQEKALELATDKVASLNEEFKNFNAIQAVLIKGGSGFVQFLQAVGNRISQLSPAFMELNSTLAVEQFEEYSKSAITAIEQVEQRAEAATRSSGQRERKSARQRMEADGVAGVISRETELVQKFEKEIKNLDKSFGDFLNTSDDKRLKDLGDYFTDQARTLRVLTNEFGNISGPITQYLNTVNSLLSSKNPEEQRRLLASLNEQYGKVNDQTAKFTQYQQLQKDNANEFTSIIQALTPETKYQTLIRSIKQERQLLAEIMKIIPAENEEMLAQFAERIRLRTEELNLLQLIDELEQRSIQRNNEFALRQERSTRRKTSGQLKVIQAELQISALRNQELKVQDQIAAVQAVIAENGGTITQDQEDSLRNYQAQLDLLKEQKITVQETSLAYNQMYDAANQALEDSLKINIGNILKAKESSLKDAMLNIAQAVVGSIADSLAEQLTNFIMNKDPLKAAQRGAITVADALTKGAAAVGAAIKEAFAVGARMSSAKSSIEDFVGPPEKRITPETASTPQEYIESIVGDFFKGGAKSKKKGPLDGIKTGIGGVLDGIGGVLFGRRVQTSAEGPEGTSVSSGFSRQGGLFSPIIRFFSNSENPFFKGLQGLFSKDNPLLQGLGSMIRGVMPLLGKLFTGAMSFVSGFFGYADGGMVKGGFRAYANGGIVSKPTLGLVGEGKYNEAIVPMPNGNAIPVDLKGAGQQQNNVTVNVSVDGNTGSMQQDSSQAGNLGQAIARAVQQELQNQKRSGGILSPYGVS